MIPRNDIPSVASVGRVTPARAVEPAADARQQEFTRSLATLVGKTMQATVLSRMTDGSYLVQVAGATARMALPANPQPGAEVPLTLVSITPRPTFALGGQDGATRTFAAAHGPEDALPPGAQASARNAANLTGQPLAAQVAAARASLLPQAQASMASMASSASTMQPGAGPRAAGTGSLSHAAALLGKAPLGPMQPASPNEKFDSAPQLSQSARVIGTVLGSAMKGEQAPTVVAARVPVVPNAPAAQSTAGPVIEPEKLAAALKDAIGSSGLFYESHVAEWSSGERPLTALMREPQNQGESVPKPPEAARPAPPEAGLRTGQQGIHDSEHARDHATEHERQVAGADPHRLRALAADVGMSERPAAKADQATAQFINLQLNSQEQGKVAWQGQLWPGQELAWQISRDAPEQQRPRGGGEEEDAGAWRSGLRFRFPLLGEIAATVVLHGDQLHIQIQAGSGDIGTLLRRRSGELASALDAAGTPLSSLTVAERVPVAGHAPAPPQDQKAHDD